MASEPYDHLCRRRSLPPNRAVAEVGGSVHKHKALFRQTSFPLNETAGGRNDDYIWLTSESNQSVCARPVTGSLYCRQGYGLHSLYCLESGILLPNCNYQQTVVYIAPDYCCSHHTWCIKGYAVISSITVILIVWYCVGIFRLRAMASDDWTDREESGPSYAPSGPLPGMFLGPALDIRSDSLYELATELQDVMGLRAVRPDAAVAKVMSVCSSRCIRMVTPDDHVTCGYHEILLHDLGDEDLPFVSLSELDYLRRTWPWAVFVKTANLAKYFPAWTVSRVEWSKMLMPCVSGVAIDMLLFSRVGSPLCHRYQLISRTGSHTVFRGTYLKRLWSFIEEMDSVGRRQGPRGLTQKVSGRMVKSTDSPAVTPPRAAVGHRSVSRGRRPRRLKGSVSTSQGFRLSERPSAEMSSVQALMELALPRFTMAEGPRVKHPPIKQQVFHSVYFDLDALASSSDDESVDVRKCKDLSVTVLCKLEEDDTPAKSEMAVSDNDSQLESGVGDVRKVVRHRDGPLGGQMTQPVRPRSRHELSAPTVDLVTGKCKPGKVIRTVSASPLTVYMTVSCNPEPDSVQQGVVADVLPPTDTVKISAADFNTSTPFVTAPILGGSDGRLKSKKSPSGDLSESSELLPSFGWSSSSSSSSSPTLPWCMAENSSPSFSPNRAREGQSQISPSEGSLFNVSPLSPIEPNWENGMPQPSGVLLPTILDEFNDSVLGEPISYARIEQAPGSESPLSLAVYAWPPKPTFMIDPIIQTVLPPPPPQNPKCSQRGPHGLCPQVWQKTPGWPIQEYRVVRTDFWSPTNSRL